MTVIVVNWNPRRPVLSGRAGRLVPLRKRVTNFGDLLGPLLVAEILKERGIPQERGTGRMLTIGSIMHLALAGDVIWGTGVNGKAMEIPRAQQLDLRAVRGPLTRAVLIDKGANVPPVFGDPALLWPRYFPRSRYLAEDQTPRGVTIVPNFHDLGLLESDPRVISPLLDPHVVIDRIARSELVVGSSLHGAILAEALGVPARLVRSGAEPTFKYDDYFLGTGRSRPYLASSVEEAVDIGGAEPLNWSSDALLDAFPVDLWTSTRERK